MRIKPCRDDDEGRTKPQHLVENLTPLDTKIVPRSLSGKDLSINNSLSRGGGVISGDLVGDPLLNVAPKRVIRQIEELIEEDVIAHELAESIHFRRVDGFQKRGLEPSSRKVAELVSRAVEERGVVEEAVLSAVAVMHIEIL
jgi:hypothetical protein